jgi:hypothetical protein
VFLIGGWSSRQLSPLGSLQDSQEDPRAGICEASKRDVQQVAEGEEPDPVEGSDPSEAEKEAVLA